MFDNVAQRNAESSKILKKRITPLVETKEHLFFLHCTSAKQEKGRNYEGQIKAQSRWKLACMYSRQRIVEAMAM